MKVLLVGDGPKNEEICSYFKDGGDSVVEVKSSDVVGLKGCIGNFDARLKNSHIDASIVLLAEEPNAEVSDIDGGRVQSIYTSDKLSKLPSKDKLSPVVFLLDYFDESPIAAHIEALSEAKMLAEQKREVYYISRFVRTACPGGEKLYCEARNEGVNFIKYEIIDIKYDSDSDSFAINVSDGVIEKTIETKTIFTEDSHVVGEEFIKITKALRIKTDELGYVNDDKFFLTSALTSRKGVYHINRNVIACGLIDALDSVVNDVIATGLEASETDDEKVVVDGEKCVFCYSCYRACPHAAIEPDSDNRVMENLTIACQECGICVSVCPGNALGLAQKDYLALNEKKDKILVMCCENSAEIAMKQTLPALGDVAEKIEVQSISCGGQVGLEDLSEALLGYEKVMIAVCMDDACKHFDGNKRACAQGDRLMELLEKAEIDESRIGCVKVSHVMPGVLKDEIIAFIGGDLS